MSVDAPAKRLRVALELAEIGVEMMRCRLARERPDLDEEQLQIALEHWMQERPGAPFGDYPGPPSTRVVGGKGS